MSYVSHVVDDDPRFKSLHSELRDRLRRGQDEVYLEARKALEATEFGLPETGREILRPIFVEMAKSLAAASVVGMVEVWVKVSELMELRDQLLNAKLETDQAS